MKRVLFILAIIIMIAGCARDDTGKAIAELTINQTNHITVLVFTNELLESSYEKLVNEKINNLNNRLREKTPITNVSFINVEVDRKYDYAKLFKLSEYPQILLIQDKEIALKTNSLAELDEFLTSKRNE